MKTVVEWGQSSNDDSVDELSADLRLCKGVDDNGGQILMLKWLWEGYWYGNRCHIMLELDRSSDNKIGRFKAVDDIRGQPHLCWSDSRKDIDRKQMPPKNVRSC